MESTAFVTSRPTLPSLHSLGLLPDALPDETRMSTSPDTAVDNIEDPYEVHFGAKTTLTTEASRNAVEQKAWATHRDKHGRLGSIITYSPNVNEATQPSTSNKIAVSVHLECLETFLMVVYSQILDKVKQPFLERQAKLPRGTPSYPVCTCISSQA